MDPLVNFEKALSKKYDPFLPMVANMVYGGCELSELSPISISNNTPKDVMDLMFKNIWIMWFEISSQNLAFLKSFLGNNSFLFLPLKLAIGYVEV